MLSTQFKEKISLQEFLHSPETEPSSEYIEGQIYQKPMPQGKHSIIQTRLSAAINTQAVSKKLACAFTELRCTFGGRSIIPDIAIFEWAHIPVDANGEIGDRFEISPDWIIEILSVDQFPNRVIDKIIFCINNGTQLGWFIDPLDKSVMVFQPNQLPSVKYDIDNLPVLSVLQDWHPKPADIFNWLKF